MKKIKEIKIVNQDGSTEVANIGADAINVDYNDTTVKAELDKLNTVDDSIMNIQANQGATLNNLELAVSNLASGSPKGAYTSATALKTANPNTGVYVVTGNGHIYSWTKNQSGDPIDLGVYQAAEDSEIVEELEAIVKSKVTIDKLSGYFNLCNLDDVVIYKNKYINGYNTSTFQPNIENREGGIVVVLPLDNKYGDYHIKLGDLPTHGHVFCRYTPNVTAAINGYAYIKTEQDWATDYDETKNEFIVHTSQITQYNTMCAVYLQGVDVPLIYASASQLLDTGTPYLKKFIGEEQLTDDLKENVNKGKIANDNLQVDISLPDVVNTIVGHEHNIYFYNVIKCSNINDYRIKVGGAHGGSKIKNLGDCIRINPTAKGQQGLTFNIYKNQGLLLTKEILVKYLNDNQPTGIKAIFIGDSMVENGYSLAELKNMLGDNITMYGTRQGGQNDSNNVWRTCYHEGRSSWSSKEYLDNAIYNNVQNAFFDPQQNKFNFSYYMQNNTSFNDVTDVFIQLGNNDVDRVNFEDYASNIQYMVDNIHEFNSNIKVYVCIPSPNVHDGYAWGTRNYSDVGTMKNKIFDYGKSLIDNITNATLVPIYQNLDCYNDFPKTTVQRSARNPETYQVCNDNVHPSKYGFYKFADTFYASILAAHNGNN